ncbi:carbon-nitrogen hydrolase family protein [Nocardioides houyundeii]|uniref:carbon-nitrogen hydrolase family protein n=1 Tax=Nocardioides houyundeii TaxID=2045452 RepID=UPI000DF35D86|nr:carbon-nitrogen hydrolase family protein [Nocardioides houyundeii]
MDQLRVTLVQEASGLDPAGNRARLAEVVPSGSDLVVLPEAFARDFGTPGSDVAPFAEPLDGPFATEVARVADERGTTVLAGMFATSPDPARPFNTLVLRGAARAAYPKIHLYDSFGYRESDRLSAGEWEPVVVEVAGFSLGLMTCYDLRFPELARDLVAAGAEVLVVPSAWVAGERKVDHWRTLLRARAIENTVYVVGVGQPGPRYTGHSSVVSPLGDVVCEAGPDAEVLHAVLERSEIQAARSVNPSLSNRRR